MRDQQYDFSGWATRNDLKCSDGRTIRKDAFKNCDGITVPLVWNHNHSEPDNVLGHALLENRPEGVYSYGKFNDTQAGQTAKELVHSGDVKALSIYANQLKEVGGDVLHGAIREVSLVLAGANPGAFIDSVMAHGDDGEETGIILGYDENIVIYNNNTLVHKDASDNEEEQQNKKEDNKDMSDNNKKNDDKTIEDVLATFNEEQKTVLAYLVGKALEDGQNEKDNEDEGEDKKVKHNVFENDEVTGGFLSHADQEDVLEFAKSKTGSFQQALEIYANENNLQHDAIASGFTTDTSATGNVTTLFPEYAEVRPGAPELITNDQGWVGTVMNKVHKSPISRIRTSQVDIRNIDTLRAKGYKKGKSKAQAGNFALIRRTTDPQTIYVKDALHRDDIVDITDFDYVQYLYNIDKMMLNEELATAIMLGDGRNEASDDKIFEDHIRPIWTDDDLYTIHQDVNDVNLDIQGDNTSNFGDNYVYAESIITSLLYARENYKGTGTPDLYCTPHMLNVMLLARDYNGRRIYQSKEDLARALNVGSINTAEQFENKTRTVTKDNNVHTKKLLGIIVNMADYSLGATKGGEVTHFTQFDIDFNQMKSLLETRVSGALTRVYSAIALEEDITSNPS